MCTGLTVQSFFCSIGLIENNLKDSSYAYGGNDFDFDVTQSQASLASYWLHFILVL